MAHFRLHPDKPLRVAHVVPTLSVGGVRTYIAQIAHTCGSDIETSVISLFSHPDRPHLAVDGAHNIPLGFAPADISSPNTLISALHATFAESAIDIVHSHHVYCDLFALPASKRAGADALRTVHGILQISPDDGFRKTTVREDWSSREIEQELSLESLVRLTICVSTHTRERIVAYGIPQSKTTVIHNGVDTTALRPPSPSAQRAARAALHLQGDPIVIGFLGRLEISKNPLFLPQVASLLRTRHAISAQFLIQGDGAEHGALVHAMTELGLESTVVIRPLSIDTGLFFAAVDIVIVPSLAEGCPFVVLESMSSALPVVAAAVGGIPELVRDGIDGLLFEPGDAGSATDHIARLALPDARRELGRRGRSRVASHFREAAQVAQVRNIYRLIASRTIT